MSWTYGRLLGLDLETSSADPMTALPVSYALVLRRDATRMSVNESLIDPGVPIPSEATDVHGITDEAVRASGVPLAEAMAFVKERLIWAAEADIPLVGMNLSFDLTIVHRMVGLSEWEGRCLDVFVLDKKLDRYRKGSRKLDALVEHYRVQQEGVGDAHSAGADAISAILVVLAMVERNPWLGKRYVTDLHNDQEKWSDEQMESLSDYFVKEGKEPIPWEDRGWPIKRGALS